MEEADIGLQIEAIEANQPAGQSLTEGKASVGVGADDREGAERRDDYWQPGLCIPTFDVCADTAGEDFVPDGQLWWLGLSGAILASTESGCIRLSAVWLDGWRGSACFARGQVRYMPYQGI